MNTTCRTCRFYAYLRDECRLHPPVRLPRKFVGILTRKRSEDVVWGHPIVSENHWCGQHQPRDGVLR